MMKETCSQQPKEPNSINMMVQSWTPPRKNYFKINWDAVVDKVDCKVGIGIIVRDENGLVSAAMRQNKSLFPNPLLAKIVGAFETIKFGLQLGSHQYHFRRRFTSYC